MRVGVLGSTGFVGQNLLAMLADDGIEHIGASRRTGLDARNMLEVSNWITKQGITHLINLAAECGGIGRNQQCPATLWAATNAITLAVLEAAQIARLQKLVLIGTVCSYAKHCPTPFREDDLMHHGRPEETNAAYGVAKLNAFFGALAFRQQYGLNAIYLLPVNMYGPHDNFDQETSHVIPALIRKFETARSQQLPSVTCWGTGNATREFLYVEDACRGIILATCDYEGAEPLNLGTGSSVSIGSLVHKIKTAIGYEGEVLWNWDRPDGQPKRMLDVTRAKEEIGFAAHTPLSEGLAHTIRWYRKHVSLEPNNSLRQD